MNTVNSNQNGFAGYEYFGVQPVSDKVGQSVCFRVCAPEAQKVFLVGDFCSWQDGIEMSRAENGVWYCEISHGAISEGNKYKYKIILHDGTEQLIADPYAVCSEESGGFASVICNIDSYVWHDATWLDYRKAFKKDFYARPMSIYRLAADSWKTENACALSYKRLADELAPYVKQLGHTHVQLLPVFSRAGLGESGYDTASHFAPHLNCGAHPCELMSFVDAMHEAGIGVIFEIPLGEVVNQISDLGGQASYERDVCAFWLDKYHADGLCLSGIMKMLEGNAEQAEGFLSAIVRELRCQFPSALIIGTGNPDIVSDGLGFDMLCNTAFDKDIAEYLGTDPFFRKHHHEKATVWSANFASRRSVLPIGFDEAGKEGAALMPRVYGDSWQRFATLRATLGYLITAPGKKLCYMGTEIGQMDEYREGKGLQWSLLDRDASARLQYYAAELGQLYLATPELWQCDGDFDGFEWIDVNNREQSIVSFCRRDIDGNEIIVAVNFTPVVYEDFRIGVKSKGEYKEIFNSDDERFGGSGVLNTGLIRSEDRDWNWQDNSIVIRIPPMAITVLKCVRRTSSRPQKQVGSIRSKIIKLK